MANTDISLEPLLNLALLSNGVNVSLYVTPAPYASMTSGRKTVAVPGTAEPLAAVSTPCKKLVVSAFGNDMVSIGDSATLVASGSERGIILIPGNDPVTLEVDNLADVYIDAITAGDGVCFVYFT